MNLRLLAGASKPGLGPAAELLLALPKSNQKASPCTPPVSSSARVARAENKSPECCADAQPVGSWFSAWTAQRCALRGGQTGRLRYAIAMSSEHVAYRGYFADQVSVFLLHAYELSRAASSLEVPKYGLARGLLLGQSMELVLKAWLIGIRQVAGMSQFAARDGIRKNYGHDLEQLWSAAVQEGLSLDEPLPYWANLLAAAHGAPYASRYPGNNDAFRVPSEDECVFVTRLAASVAAKLGKQLQWD